jgi:hypothetical protein
LYDAAPRQREVERDRARADFNVPDMRATRRVLFSSFVFLASL